jgi:hypothetical protein
MAKAMKYDLVNALERIRHHLGDDDYALWSSALRRELTLWLRASTAELPAADRVRIELVVDIALGAVGIIEMS